MLCQPMTLVAFGSYNAGMYEVRVTNGFIPTRAGPGCVVVTSPHYPELGEMLRQGEMVVKAWANSTAPKIVHATYEVPERVVLQVYGEGGAPVDDDFQFQLLHVDGALETYRF